jgi:ribose transport system permease protein
MVNLSSPARDRLRRTAPLIVLLVLCAGLSVATEGFLDLWNFGRLLSASAIPLVLVMGATFIILTGSIDLSVEGGIAVSGVLVSMLVLNNVTKLDFGLWAVPIGIALGGLIGLLNGVVHVKLKAPSFMTTLGIGFACIGVATAILGGDTVRISDQTFRAIFLKRFLGLPYGVWIAFGAVAIALFIQQRTLLGRWLYAIGGDEEIARQVGVRVERTRILAFGLAGLFTGLAGVLAAAQLGQGHALLGSGRLFTTITSTVVGGVALSGGVGSVLDAVVGVLIVVTLDNGLVLLGVPPFFQVAVQGLLIITAVALSLDRSRLSVVK